MTTALVPINDLERMAAVVVKSGLFGVKSPEQAMTLMLLAQAEGVHPAVAMRDYHIVEGKPALKADAMLARFQAGGGKVEWVEYTDTKVSAKFSHPQFSPAPVLIEWDLERAGKVKIKSDGGWKPMTEKYNWKAYPRQMLKARVISEGVRATNPGVAVGIYTPEEVQDFAPEKDITPPKDDVAAAVVAATVTPTAGAKERLSKEQEEKVDKVVSSAVDWITNGSFEDAAAVIDEAAFDADESVYLWTQFDAKTRRLLKDAHKARATRAQAAAQA